MTVESAGKHHAGDGRDGGRLCRTAARHIAAARMGRAPDDFAGRKLERIDASADARLQQEAAPAVKCLLRARCPLRRGANPNVRDGNIHVILVDCRTPLHAAHRTSAAHPALPDDFTLPVRIDRMHHPGLLTGDQHAPAIGQFHQDRRRAEIQIRSLRLRTVGAVPADAGKGVGIAGRHLARPRDLTGVHAKGDERIGRIGRRVRITVAGRHIDHSSIEIDGG